MTIPTHTGRKRELRSLLRATPVNAALHNPRIRDRVARWLECRPHLTHIALYHPLPDEPDLLPLLDRLPERSWYFPRISGDTMTFHRVPSPANDLAPGAFGILEPKPALPAVEPDKIQAFLCPGMAFEKTSGLRLGRGKGYYDRYLSRARPDARFIGITFPERIVTDTFAEPHDIRMHLVVF